MFWDQSYNVSAPAGVVGYTTFRANSVYDPDFSGIGSTTAAYFQMQALYGRYRVLAVTAHVEFMSTGATPGTVFIVANPLNTLGALTIAEICAQRHIWRKSLTSVSGAGQVSHVVSFPIHKIYGVPKKQVRNEDDFAGLIGGNPNNEVFIHIGAHSPTAAVYTFSINIRLEYDVVWSLPKTLAY